MGGDWKIGWKSGRVGGWRTDWLEEGQIGRLEYWTIWWLTGWEKWWLEECEIVGLEVWMIGWVEYSGIGQKSFFEVTIRIISHHFVSIAIASPIPITVKNCKKL